MPKGTCQAEAMSISEKIKLLVLAIIELRLSKAIKFCGNVTLKVFWGLFIPHHICQDVTKLL